MNESPEKEARVSHSLEQRLGFDVEGFESTRKVSIPTSVCAFNLSLLTCSLYRK